MLLERINLEVLLFAELIRRWFICELSLGMSREPMEEFKWKGCRWHLTILSFFFSLAAASVHLKKIGESAINKFRIAINLFTKLEHNGKEDDRKKSVGNVFLSLWVRVRFVPSRILFFVSNKIKRLMCSCSGCSWNLKRNLHSPRLDGRLEVCRFEMLNRLSRGYKNENRKLRLERLEASHWMVQQRDRQISFTF